MAALTLRNTKGTPLTNAELDANFTNLNTDKAELNSPVFVNSATSRKFLVNADGTPSVNLGSPSIAEMALFDPQFNNKTEFYDIANVFIETSTDGTTWSTFSVSDSQKRILISGDPNSSIGIPYNTAYFRVRFRATSYVYLDALYVYFSSNGHSTQVQIYKKHDSGTYTQHTSSTSQAAGWPGHIYLPFSTVPFHPTGTLGTHYHEVSVVFIPTWNPTYSANSISLSKLQIWGGYPAGKRNLYYTDELANATFPAGLTVSSALTLNSDIQQNNATYLKGKLAAGTTTRLFGLNAADSLYIGSIDANHTGGTLFVKNGGVQAKIDASGNFGVPAGNQLNFVTSGNTGTWLGGIQDATSGWSLNNASIGFKSDDTTYAAIGIGTANGLLYFGRTNASGAGTLASWLEVNSSGVANFKLARPQHNGSNLALVSELPTVNNATLTLNVSGTGLSGSQTFTANQSTAATFTVTSNATHLNTASTIVSRDANGDFTARYGNFSYVNTSDDVSTGTLTYLMGKFGDNYYRSATAAKVATFISGQTMNIAGNASTATTLQTARTINGVSFNGSANILAPSDWYHSSRDFPNGTLVESTIDYSVTAGDPWILEIRGNSYGSLVPFEIQYQGYIYSDTIINHGGYSVGTSLTGLVVFNYNGKLCFWWPNQTYWHGYNIRIYTAQATYPINKVNSVTNVAKPIAITKEVALSANIRQVWHSGNLTNLSQLTNGPGYITASANTATASAWQTARTLTIGSTGKSVDGSVNVSWTLGEIGALGATAKAADSELLDGIDSSRFVYGTNATASNAAPVTYDAYNVTQNKSGFWEINGAAWTPDTGWWWGLTTAHTSNGAAYNYGGQLIIGNGQSEAYFRSIGNGTPTAWRRLWHDGNLTNLNQLTNGPGYTTNVGTVTNVTGTAPISVATGTTTPAISISAATTSAAGSMSAADKTKLDGIATNANNYSLPAATSTVLGGIELFSDTTQTVAANAVTATASRTYGIQVNAAGQAVVNVPWTDANSGGTVTTLSVASANGFAGTVATATTTPAITISTSVTGILYGNGTSVAAATAGNFPTLNQSTTGNASTATTLQTARSINGISFNGSADIVVPTTYDTGFKTIVNPGGATYNTTTASVTGAIAITLPVGMTGTMLRMTVRIYEYTTNESFDVYCGGYNYATGNTWTNSPFAYIIGNPGVDRRFAVRFGYTAAGKAVVYIGELASVWSYPQVFVTDVQCGFGGLTTTFTSGWTVGFQAVAFENVTATISNSQVGYAVSANSANAVVLRDGSGNFSAGTITAALTGNASTASTWQTARTITIGSTGKSVDGSAAVSWTLGEIGAAAASHTQAISTISDSTTVGQNLVKLTNPTAVTFLRVNADNTVSALDAATFRTAIGAGTSSTTGTVTSVTGTAPIVSSGGTTPAISITAATTIAAGSMSAADKTKLDGIASGATANTGTVTSVGGTGTVAGLTLSGSVTSSGNLTLSGTLSTPVSTINDSTTVGQNLVKLTNPTAVTFLRVNADNTVSALDAATFRTAIGAGTSSTTGTVTSVGGTGTVAGLTLSGSVTSSGNLTLSGTLSTPVSTINDSTTVGRNLVKLTNPTAVTFLRVNADNTVSALDAATFRTAIGAGTSSTTGTVTSVGGTGTVAGLTLSGSVTSSGNLTLSGTLSTPVSTINDSTTVGRNLVKLTNPTAVTFLRVNADNTVSALDAATFRTAIGAGTSSTTGTVTSVTGTAPVVSSGGTTPAISMAAATASVNGYMTSTYASKLDGIAANANNYSLPAASSTVLGGIELASDTVQTVAANAVSATASRTYGVQVNAAGQAVVNVPWTDTDTNSGGTVTSVSVASANGFAGTVATASSTPAITISTSITGILYGNGTSVAAATAGNFPTLNQNTTGNAATVTNGVYTTGNQTIGGTKTFSSSVNIQNSTNEMQIYLGSSGAYIYGNTTTVGVYKAAAASFGIDVATGNVSTNGSITASGNITAYSDARLKKDLVKITSALDKLEQLTGYTYTRTDTNQRQTGLLAQDVETVLPEVVDSTGEYKSLAYGNMLGLIVEAIKELRQEVRALR